MDRLVIVEKSLYQKVGQMVAMVAMAVVFF